MDNEAGNLFALICVYIIRSVKNTGLKVVSLHKNYQSLIAKARKGNHKAQHQLFELFAPKMLSVCRQYLKNNALAEEVMLSGFLKVFTHLNSFKFEG
ncbi:MAG: hypothetical protein L3J09_12645, partial [Flavobacteriaceae bacterium]|nr:hypothetical protein [Flavobacteriaceae bacterium]